MGIRKFEDIEAWQLARDLSRKIHALAHNGTFARDHSLRDQIERSSGSAMDNIAEGFDGGSNPEFAKFLAYSQRSSREVQSQLYRALDRKHLTENEFKELYELADHVNRKVGAFIKYLKNCSPERGTTNEERRTKNDTP